MFSGDAPSASTIAEPENALALYLEVVPSARQLLSSTDLQAAVSRWDWLAGTVWYVPPENVLAYYAPSDLSDPTPIADQTIWMFNQSSNGQISGQTTVKFSIVPVPITTTFTGVITPAGQVRMEFGSEPTTGIGQMRFIDGAWRVEMQMVTGQSGLITHWAYMSQLPSTSPQPGVPDSLPPDSFRSDEWNWLLGTRWALSDAALLGGDGLGVFEFEGYREGYYWGSGTSSEPFNVLGSITPEGNVLMLISIDGAFPASRTGIIRETSTGGVMRLRAYEGTPDVGFAWLLPTLTG
jgi:hypothetical protein